MNLPKLEPIVWRKPEPKREPKPATINVQFLAQGSRDNIRHDYIGPDGLLHIHYPGLPELN
jgi:hypothetical protein